MNLAVWTILTVGLVAGQPPEDYRAHRTRSLRLDLEPIEAADRPKIRQIELHVSEDQGGVWTVESTIKPDQPYLTFQAKKDGSYWLKLVTVFTDGKTDPENVAQAPPTQKILIDTTPPIVRIPMGDRSGEETVVNWTIEDRFPNDSKTKLEYRLPGGTDLDWKPLPVSGADRRSSRFKTPSNGPFQLRVSVEDAAGNTANALKEVLAPSTSSFYTGGDVKPAAGSGPMPTTSGSPGALKAPEASNLVIPTVLPVPTIGGSPESSGMPAAPAPAAIPAPSLAPGSPTAPVLDLTKEPAKEEPKPNVLASGAGPVVTPSQPAASPASTALPPMSELPPAQVINYTRFDLPYQIDAGPSGVARIDLYVTRDDGRSWLKWSEHDGKESPLKVNLDDRPNTTREGVYGFRLVAHSGAGLSGSPPTSGTAPDIRVEIDETPPLIQIFTPESDPNQKDVLVLKWAVKDKNVRNTPVTLEWSENTTGPWRSVAGGEGTILAAGGVGAPVGNIPNTGSYSWHIPSNLPTHRVHLRMMAWDAAGNKSEVVTPPVLVDLMKPRARIQGVQPQSAPTIRSPISPSK